MVESTAHCGVIRKLVTHVRLPSLTIPYGSPFRRPLKSRAQRLRNIRITGLALLIGALPCSGQADWAIDTQPIMGTAVHVEVWHHDTALAREGVKLVMVEMRRIEAMMSPYIENSSLARLNRLGHSAAQVVPAEMFKLISHANDISRLSQGAFDITFAAIGHLYDYRKHIRPDADVIAAKLPLVNFRHLRLDERHTKIEYAREGVRIDLGGIAKGYAVDSAVDQLIQNGFTSALVTAGGDSRVIGKKNAKPWMIGVKHPRKPDQMIAIMPLEDSAISTSGDYERYFVDNGQRYHHIINPQTGEPADLCQSVTIIGPRGQITDALSTTVFVLGPHDGMALLKHFPDFEAVIIDNKGRMHLTRGLEQIDTAVTD